MIYLGLIEQFFTQPWSKALKSQKPRKWLTKNNKLHLNMFSYFLWCKFTDPDRGI